MELSKVNTHELEFDPTSSDFIKRLEAIPEFKPDTWPAKALEKQKVYTYVVLMYDLNCNLRHFFPNYWHRKRIAAQTAGFELEGKRFRKVVEKMLMGEIESVNRMAVRYVAMFNQPSFLSLISNLEAFVQETAAVMAPNDSETKKKQVANIQNFNKNIKELTVDLFGGDEIEGYRRELYKTAISEILNLRPELVATRLQDGEQPTEVFYDDEEDLDG